MLKAALPPPGPALVASRVARAGGRALEHLGQMRMELRRLDGRARRRVAAARLAEVCRELCRMHGFDVRVEGALPRGPFVMVANHVSYVDALVLTGLAPCAPVAKAEVERWPVIGSGARLCGVVFVDRADAWSGARALRQALRLLAAGVAVLGFPEGTTTDGSALLPFRRGLFGAARLARVPVVPVAVAYPDAPIAWTGDALFLPHYLRTAARPLTLCRVRIGAPLDPGAFRSAEAMAGAARLHIHRLLGDDSR